MRDMIGGETAGTGGMADLMRGGGGGSVEAVAVAARDVASSSPSKPASALDMMRYQRIEPDCLPLPNGGGSDGSRKQPTPAPAPAPRDVDVPVVASDSSRVASYLPIAPLEPKPRARALHPLLPAAPAQAPALSPPAVAATQSPARDHGHHPADIPDHTSADPNGGSGSLDAAMLLQWGLNKRCRGRRDATATPPSSPAPVTPPSEVRRQPVLKIKRRSSAPAEKLMPPPGTRGPNLRITSSLPSRPAAAADAAADALHGRDASLPRQRSAAVEERAGGQQQPPQPAVVTTATLPKPRGRRPAEAGLGTSKPKKQQKRAHHLQGDVSSRDAAAAAFGSPSPSSSKQPAPLPPPQKLGLPRICTTLTRKEKEEDFMAMKGTKLPQRPKKRSKHAEKAVSYICPGAWLSEVTRHKYAVRERKSRKQKQRRSGLKAMESSDSD